MEERFRGLTVGQIADLGISDKYPNDAEFSDYIRGEFRDYISDIGRQNITTHQLSSYLAMAFANFQSTPQGTARLTKLAEKYCEGSDDAQEWIFSTLAERVLEEATSNKISIDALAKSTASDYFDRF